MEESLYNHPEAAIAVKVSQLTVLGHSGFLSFVRRSTTFVLVPTAGRAAEYFPLRACPRAERDTPGADESCEGRISPLRNRRRPFHSFGDEAFPRAPKVRLNRTLSDPGASFRVSSPDVLGEPVVHRHLGLKRHLQGEDIFRVHLKRMMFFKLTSR